MAERRPHRVWASAVRHGCEQLERECVWAFLCGSGLGVRRPAEQHLFSVVAGADVPGGGFPVVGFGAGELAPYLLVGVARRERAVRFDQRPDLVAEVGRFFS